MLHTLDSTIGKHKKVVKCLVEDLLKIHDLAFCEPSEGQQINYYCAVFRSQQTLRPRELAEECARRGVPNSVGSFGLRPVETWPAFSRYLAEGQDTCKNAEMLLSSVLAIPINRTMTSDDAITFGRKIAQARQSCLS